MNLNPEGMNKPTRYLALNQSRITDYMMCPRFYQLRHIDRLDRGTKALRIGSETHRALESYSKLKAEGKDYEPEKPPDLPEEDWEVVEKLFYAYRREFKDEDIVVIQPEIEVSHRFGSVETPNALWEIWLIATLDGIVAADTRRYLKEYKTCANLGSAQFAKFLNDYQVSTYLWLAWKELDIHLDGAIITLLPKTKNPTPVRLTVVRGEHQIREWERTTLWEARNIIQNLEADYFPQRQINCTKWNRACIFQDFCITGERTNLVDLEIREPDYADKLSRQLKDGKHGNS